MYLKCKSLPNGTVDDEDIHVADTT